MAINITGNVTLLKNTAVDSSGVAIAPTSLEYGQIAINYNAKDPCIFIKVLGDNGATSIQKFVGEAVIAKTLSDILGESAADLATLKDLIKQFEGSSSDVLTLVKNLTTEVGNKANTSDLNAHKNNTSNPHSVTKAQVGLSNVRDVAQLGQTETAADSSKLGGVAAGNYWRNTNSGTKDHNWSALNSYAYNAFELINVDKRSVLIHTSASKGGYMVLCDINGNQSGVIRGYNIGGLQAEFNVGGIGIGGTNITGARAHFFNKGAAQAFVIGGTTDVNNPNNFTLWNFNKGDITIGTNGTKRLNITKDGAIVIGGDSYGTSPAPLNYDLSFKGHYEGDYARIRSVEQSGSSAHGTLQFFTRGKGGSAKQEPNLAMTIDWDKSVKVEGILSSKAGVWLYNSSNKIVASLDMNSNGGFVAAKDNNGNIQSIMRGYVVGGLQAEFLLGGIQIGSTSVTGSRAHFANKGAANYFLVGTSNNTSTPNNAIVWNQNNGSILFGVGDVEKMKLTNTGNLELQGCMKLGNSSASKHLEFTRGGINYICAPTSGSFGFVPNGGAADGGTIRLMITNDGKTIVGGGDLNANATLDVRGNIRTPNTIDLCYLNTASPRASIGYWQPQGYDFGLNFDLSAAAGPSRNVNFCNVNKTTMSGNLIVKGEAVTYSQDGVEARTVAAASATRLADLEDVDLTGASDNFVLYRSNTTNANGDKIWKARKETDSYTELKNIPSEFTPVAHNHIGGNYTTLSDERLKKNFTSLANPLNTILSINTYNFNWTEEALDKYHFIDKKSTGVKAQELQKILPELVNDMGDGTLSVDYIQIIPYLIDSVKQLNSELANKNIAIENARKDYKRAYGESVNLKKEVDILKLEIDEMKSLIKQNLI